MYYWCDWRITQLYSTIILSNYHRKERLTCCINIVQITHYIKTKTNKPRGNAYYAFQKGSPRNIYTLENNFTWPSTSITFIICFNSYRVYVPSKSLRGKLRQREGNMFDLEFGILNELQHQHIVHSHSLRNPNFYFLKQ